MRSRAIYTTDTTSYVKVDEIYNDTTGAFDADNVNALLKYITGNSSITYENATDTLNEMTSTSNDNEATTSADIRAKTVTVNGITKSSSQDVIVRFGGLDWQVVYLSKTTPESGEDIILTLWLSSSQQDAFAGRTSTEGELYGFIKNSLYSDWSADWSSSSLGSYPSNMYGTSYIRAVTLNNGGQYALGSEELSQIDKNDPFNGQNPNSVFARFTMEEVKNSLTQYITTPNKVSWQLDQSAYSELGSSFSSYNAPNDSIDVPTSGSYYTHSTYGSMNFHTKTNYDEWATDYIWLPSITETGYDSSRTGIWETSTEQRRNLSSSTSNNGTVGSSNVKFPGSYNHSRLRSGNTSNANAAYSLNPSGSLSVRHVDFSRAVRPALHLNLNEVLANTEYPPPFVNVDELYDDEAGKMSEENVNVLLKYITGQADVSVDNASEVLGSLASATKSSEDFRANVVSATGANKQAGQEIKITFGGLDWWAVYLSKANGTGDNILTLWLDESQQDAFSGRTSTEGELYGFINNSLYSDWAYDWAVDNGSYNYPSNMYGSSYIRVVTLNAGGKYGLEGGSSPSAEQAQNENSVFARFTMEEVEGSLTQYITTPSKMSWQRLQSAVEEGLNSTYFFPNDSIDNPTGVLSGKYFNRNTTENYNYHGKTLYTAWENDYLWLPSMTETGYDSSHTGIWETSTEQCRNLSSSTSNNGTVGSSNSPSLLFPALNHSWLRSGCSNDAFSALSLNSSGSVAGNGSVAFSYAVRPALHLNLSKVIMDVLGVQKIVLNNQGGEGASGMYISGEGFFADEALKEPITKVEVPTKAGYVFEGYYTSADGGVQMIEADGTILGSALDYQNITTLFAVWSEGNLAKYDSVGGYWYVENGRMPQSRVTDEATIEALNTSTLSGDVYEFAGMRFGSVKLSGSENEYFKFDDKWYKVEPIRWRLVYSSAQTSGYGTTEATMAILAEIVYVDAYSDAKLMGGAGYSAESVAPFMTNHINEDKFVTETRTVDIFSETAGSTTTTVSGNVFVASKEEINLFKTTANGTGETVNVGFSDLVSDYLVSLGKGEYYFTRSLGNQLNNFHCLNPVGASTQVRAQQAYGIMFSTKVKGYGCQ